MLRSGVRTPYPPLSEHRWKTLRVTGAALFIARIPHRVWPIALVSPRLMTGVDLYWPIAGPTHKRGRIHALRVLQWRRRLHVLLSPTWCEHFTAHAPRPGVGLPGSRALLACRMCRSRRSADLTIEQNADDLDAGARPRWRQRVLLILIGHSMGCQVLSSSTPTGILGAPAGAGHVVWLLRVGRMDTFLRPAPNARHGVRCGAAHGQDCVWRHPECATLAPSLLSVALSRLTWPPPSACLGSRTTHRPSTTFTRYLEHHVAHGHARYLLPHGHRKWPTTTRDRSSGTSLAAPTLDRSPGSATSSRLLHLSRRHGRSMLPQGRVDGAGRCDPRGHRGASRGDQRVAWSASSANG